MGSDGNGFLGVIWSVAVDWAYPKLPAPGYCSGVDVQQEKGIY